MAHAVAPWSRSNDPKTSKVSFTAEASELGLRPGVSPRTLVVDNIVVSGFKPFTTSGGSDDRSAIVGWTVTLNGITYTIFND